MTTSTQTPAADTPADPDPSERRRGPLQRALRWLVAAALVAALLVAAVTVLVGIGVQRDADVGKVEMSKGRRALAEGDISQALDHFRAAEDRFEQARSATSSGIGGVVAAVPVLGRSLDVAAGISEAGVTLSGAAVDLASAIEELPGGLGALAPVDGRIPVDTLASLADEVEAAADDVAAALETVRATPSTWIPATVAEARFQAEEQVAGLWDSLDAASVLMSGLPALLGSGEPTRYLVIAESPAEQRGTGGIWGAYTIMTARDGRLSFGPFAQLQDFPEVPSDELPPPSPDYRENYDQYGGAGAWSDLNMTPDLPSAARAVLSAYAYSTGEELDGVLVADPFAVKEMLRVTGPAEVPALDVTVRAGTVVDFMTNEAYTLFPFRGRERKAVLGAVVGEAFDRFLGQPGRSTAKLRAIVNAMAAGHLRLYTTDRRMQSALGKAGVDSALRGADGADLLAVQVNSRSGSKVDFYAMRTVDHEVQLGGAGEAFATTTVTLDNEAPTSGVPGYVIDPNVRGYEPGDNVSLVSSSCPASCDLVVAERNGDEIPMAKGAELGTTWYQDFFTTPGGETSTLTIVTRRGDVWRGNSSGGTYRLVVLPQTTVRPTEFTIGVTVPDGTEVTWTSTLMRVDGDRAVWRGVPQGRMELVVRFRAPLPLRWWRNFVRALP
jgi:hypothetical protein